MRVVERNIEIVNESLIEFPVLPNGPGWASTEGDRLSVIESGKDRVLFSKFIKAIEGAKRLVCLQSFLIQDTEIIDALIDAVENRGVKVFVLSSVETRLKASIEEEPDFIKEDYINLLESKFKNHFVHRSAENFHGKYILVDPTTKPKGFICTNNFTQNGFTKNPELAVELNVEQCEELFKVFVYHFWEYSSDEQNATNEFASVKPAQKFSLPEFQHILLTSPNTKLNSLNKTLLKAVSKAKETISLSTFQMDKSTELVRAVSDKAKQGVSVTLFCRPMEQQFNEQLKPLLDAGVTVCFHPFMHSKSLLVDDKVGFVFTANLVANGLDNGLEVGVQLNEKQARDLVKIHQEWKKTFPAKAIRDSYVKELNEILVFKGRRLISKRLIDEKKSVNKKVETVSELFSFFNQRPHIKDHLTKTLKVKLSAEIEDSPVKHKVTGDSNFEIVEIEDGKKGKSKVVVVNSKFDVDELDLIQQWKELKIYAEV